MWEHISVTILNYYFSFHSSLCWQNGGSFRGVDCHLHPSFDWNGKGGQALTLGDSMSIFFEKAIQFNNFILDLNWIESKGEEIFTMLIHFKNFPIISLFYTNSTSKTIIDCFKSKIKVNWFHDRFDVTSIIELNWGW